MNRADALAFLGLPPDPPQGSDAATPYNEQSTGQQQQAPSTALPSVAEQPAVNLSSQEQLPKSSPSFNLPPNTGGVDFSQSPYKNSPLVGSATPDPIQSAQGRNQQQVSPVSQQTSDDSATSPEDQTKRPVGFWEAADRGLTGGLAKANEMMAQGVGVFP